MKSSFVNCYLGNNNDILLGNFFKYTYLYKLLNLLIVIY